jgi:hypothetical protein
VCVCVRARVREWVCVSGCACARETREDCQPSGARGERGPKRTGSRGGVSNVVRHSGDRWSNSRVPSVGDSGTSSLSTSDGESGPNCGPPFVEVAVRGWWLCGRSWWVYMRRRFTPANAVSTRQESVRRDGRDWCVCQSEYVPDVDVWLSRRSGSWVANRSPQNSTRKV